MKTAIRVHPLTSTGSCLKYNADAVMSRVLLRIRVQSYTMGTFKRAFVHVYTYTYMYVYVTFVVRFAVELFVMGANVEIVETLKVRTPAIIIGWVAIVVASLQSDLVCMVFITSPPSGIGLSS